MNLTPAAMLAVSNVFAPTERDKQTAIGVSEIGDDCERCIADKLLGIPHDTENTGTPLAPFLGTAFHAYAESRTKNDPNVLVEQRVEVCDLEDYGRISGSVDRFDIAAATVLDWKLLSRKKISAFRKSIKWDNGLPRFANTAAGSQFRKYYIQIMLYGYGLTQLGHEVAHCSIVALPRDCSVEVVPDSISEFSFPWRRDVALAAIERLQNIWERARSHDGGVDSLQSSPLCWYCSHERHTEAFKNYNING